MIKILVGLSLLALVESVSAHPQRYPFSVTGYGLIEQFYGPEASRGKPRTSIEYQRNEIARGYISGVKDTSEGTAWCHRVEELASSSAGKADWTGTKKKHQRPFGSWRNIDINRREDVQRTERIR